MIFSGSYKSPPYAPELSTFPDRSLSAGARLSVLLSYLNLIKANAMRLEVFCQDRLGLTRELLDLLVAPQH
ncbi:Transcriptional regulatory protein tyrR [Pantoea agglomerans]|uniref:Transcriptional regulatory protein tyrR n=1 Tax=Enterobacter agglomerans TaxID=549 RepID=A0A379AFM3_ENTAG|nr:Transcriptional regulatory protein tyrR [Pantoea agglomerans]